MKNTLIFIVISLLVSCSTPKILIQNGALKERKNLTYENWGKAINDANFNAATIFADSIHKKLATDGFKALYDGNYLKAEALLCQINDTNYNFKESIILPYLSHHQIFKECCFLADKIGNTKYSICKDFLNFPPPIIHIQEQEIIVPIHSFNYGRTPIVEVKVDGITKRFMVDTGFSSTTISEKTAKKCGIKTQKSNLKLVDVNEFETNTQIGYIKNFNIGLLPISNQPVFIVKNLSLKFLGMSVFKIDGVIGWDILQQLKVKINSKDKYIAFSKTGKDGNFNNLHAITSPFITLQDENGVNYFFHFDTGAKKTELFEKAFSKISKPVSGKKNRLSFGLNSTSHYKSNIYKNISFILGDKYFNFEKIEMTPKRFFSGFVEYDGRIGMDMFENGILEFDYQKGYVVYRE